MNREHAAGIVAGRAEVLALIEEHIAHAEKAAQGVLDDVKSGKRAPGRESERVWQERSTWAYRDRGLAAKVKHLPHPSHEMTPWRTEPRAPTGGEPRFYGVRECRRCEAEELDHPAGHFDGDGALKRACKGGA